MASDIAGTPHRHVQQALGQSFWKKPSACSDMHSLVFRMCWRNRGEALGLAGGAGVLCSLMGLVVLMHPPMLFGGHVSWGAQRIWGSSCGVLSAFFSAGAFISIR